MNYQILKTSSNTLGELKVIVKHWENGECACTGTQKTLTFKTAPTDADIRYSIKNSN